MRSILMFIVTALLTGCMSMPPGPSPFVEVDGIPVRYTVAPLPNNWAGLTSHAMSGLYRYCDVTISDVWPTWTKAEFLRTVAHEIGHCQDIFKLNFSHNGFGNAGCVFNEYYCTPAEGYAEAYHRLYKKVCGNMNALPLKTTFRPLDEFDKPCSVPPATVVTPDIADDLAKDPSIVIY